MKFYLRCPTRKPQFRGQSVLYKKGHTPATTVHFSYPQLNADFANQHNNEKWLSRMELMVYSKS